MKHGTYTSYTTGACRCDACRRAGTLYQKKYRMGRRQLVPSIGSLRRIQALAWMGWSATDVAERLDLTRSCVDRLHLVDSISAERARAIAKLFNELHMKQGPSSMAAAIARKRGWAPPLAWDEDTIDAPAASPDLGSDELGEIDPIYLEELLAGTVRNKPNLHERRQAMRAMIELGLSNREIAEKLFVDPVTVLRFRRSWSPSTG